MLISYRVKSSERAEKYLYKYLHPAHPLTFGSGHHRAVPEIVESACGRVSGVEEGET